MAWGPLPLSRQVALILDFAANARRMSNTKNVYPRTPTHPHTLTQTHTHTRKQWQCNLYAFHWLRLRLRLRLSCLVCPGRASQSPSQPSSTTPSSSPAMAQPRIRSAALYAMHFSALLTLERALGQSGRDPSSTRCTTCPACIVPLLPTASPLQRSCLVSKSSFPRCVHVRVCECVSASVCVSVCASVVCLKGYVLHSSLYAYVCVFVCLPALCRRHFDKKNKQRASLIQSE